MIAQDPQADWVGIDPQDESELPNLDAEVSVGGIYLRLLIANPGWVLRKPKEIVGELLEAGLQGLQKEAVIFVLITIFLIVNLCLDVVDTQWISLCNQKWNSAQLIIKLDRKVEDYQLKLFSD